MVINDRLKGEYYRTPITKLSSRRNIENTIDDLIKYYNNLSSMLDTCFNNISQNKEILYTKLMNIYERTLHFKYILDNFEVEVEQHITERLNLAIGGFTNKLLEYVEPFKNNLFRHNSADESLISLYYITEEFQDEYNKTKNSLSSDLGIRWFSGKLDNKSFINNLNGVLNICKMQEKTKNDESINSNIILDLFIYMKTGMIWLTLGQNGSFGYNFILKYKSPDIKLNLTLSSQEYNTRDNFDLNRFDFNMIVDTLLTQNDLQDGNIYIKVKTNIPINQSTGKEQYFISGKNTFDSYQNNLQTKLFNDSIISHDNLDALGINVLDENIDPKTRMLLNAKVKNKFRNDEYNTNRFISLFNVRPNNINQTIYKNGFQRFDADKMENITDEMSGYFISNNDGYEDVFIDYDKKLASKIFNRADIKPKYFDKEQLVDLNNENYINESVLLPKNENMFAIDNTDSNKCVLPGENPFVHGYGNTIINEISNNINLDLIDDKGYFERTPKVLFGSMVTSNSNNIENNLSSVTPPDFPGQGEFYIRCTFESDYFNFYLVSIYNGLYRIDNNLRYTAISLNGLANIVYDIIETKDHYILLATDGGILVYTPDVGVSVYGTGNSGIQTGTWSKFFKLGTKTDYRVVAIRKNFYTVVTDDNKISYGESMCIENNHTMTLFKNFYGINNTSDYSFKYSEIENEFVNRCNTLEEEYVNGIATTETWKQQLNQYNIIENPENNTIYFFNYNSRMMCLHYDLSNTSRPVIDDITFAQGYIQNYNIISAVKKDDTIYFTGKYERRDNEGNVLPPDYNIDDGEIRNYSFHCVHGNFTKIEIYEKNKFENSINISERLYFASSIETLISDEIINHNPDPNADPDEDYIIRRDLRTNCIVKKINNEIFFIPHFNSYCEINDIIYLNGCYYILDVDGKYIFRLDNKMRTTKVIERPNPDDNNVVALKKVGNLILFDNRYSVSTDNKSLNHYRNSDFFINQNNVINIIHTDTI